MACSTGSRSDRDHVLRVGQEVDLEFGETVSESNAPIRYAYFPTTSYISLITPKGAAQSLEVGSVGSEGVFGITLLLGIDTSPLKGLVQGAGKAIRVGAEQFRRAAAERRSLERVTDAYLYVLMAQIAQTAACGRYHPLEARMARWLLMTHDRAGSDSFRLTHEFLSQMLGVRRAGVTEAAGVFQKRNLIHYRRGFVRILNRAGIDGLMLTTVA
jgi:CRP-like cAMP-binding protein